MQSAVWDGPALHAAGPTLASLDPFLKLSATDHALGPVLVRAQHHLHSGRSQIHQREVVEECCNHLCCLLPMMVTNSSII